jgi:hypothetical protein
MGRMVKNIIFRQKNQHICSYKLRTVFHISMYASYMCWAIYCGHVDTSCVKYDRYITILSIYFVFIKSDDGGHFECQDGGR